MGSVSVHDLAPITALGGADAREDVHGGVTLAERPDVALASYAARRGREDGAAARLADLIGVEAAPGPGRAAFGRLASWWTGPDAWMIEAPFETHEDLAARAAETADGAASVTEQTDGWTRFDLSGARVADVLERLTALDVHAASPGTAHRTTIEHLGCFAIWREGGTVSVVGPRSAAGSLHHAMLTAMRSAL